MIETYLIKIKFSSSKRVAPICIFESCSPWPRNSYYPSRFSRSPLSSELQPDKFYTFLPLIYIHKNLWERVFGYSKTKSLSHFSQQSKSTGGAPRTTSTSELWPKQSSWRRQGSSSSSTSQSTASHSTKSTASAPPIASTSLRCSRVKPARATESILSLKSNQD